MRGWKVCWLLVLLSGCAVDATSVEDTSEPELYRQQHHLDLDQGSKPIKKSGLPSTSTPEKEYEATTLGSGAPGEEVSVTPDSKPQPDPWHQGMGEHPDKPQPDPWRFDQRRGY